MLRGPIKMAATECGFYHEGGCIGKHEIGEDFKCKGMKEDNNIFIECIASNNDLVDGCEMCELAVADAAPPFDYCCKKCGKEQEEMEEYTNALSKKPDLASLDGEED